MQLRFKTTLSCREYVTERAWRDAALERCPLHPDGGCSFARHGTYERVEPPGTRIPRWYCPEGHRTFSLLADCFASRLPGSLSDLERVVSEVEQARSLEAAADGLRTDDVSLPGAIRWTRRRVQQVHAVLRDLARAHTGMPLRLPAHRQRASTVARCGMGPSAGAGNGRRVPRRAAVSGWFCLPSADRQSRRTDPTRQGARPAARGRVSFSTIAFVDALLEKRIR